MSDDTPPTPAAAAPPALACHACSAAAILVYRLVPHSHGPDGARSVWDTVATDVPACSRHLAEAKRLGTVLGARALSDVVVTRTVQP